MTHGVSSERIGERIFRNVLALLTGRGLSLLLSMAASILLARYLGSEQLGQYGALYAYLGLYTWLATFGLEEILAREAAQRRQQASSVLYTGAVLSAGFGLFGLLAAFFLAPFFGYSGQLRFLLLLAGADLLLLNPMRFPGIVFQVDLKQWWRVGTGLVRQVLWLSALALLALGQAAFVWVILARTLCSVAEAVLIVAITRRPEFLSRSWQFLRSETKNFVRYGFPIAVSGLAVSVYNRIDQVMLHKMTTDQLLGHYVVAVNIVELFSALPVALMSSLYPVLAQVASQEERFRHYLGLSYRSMMAVVFGVCAVLIPVGLPLIRLFYGPEYASSAPMVVVLIWSEVPVFFGVVITNALIAQNLQRYLPASTGLGALTNIVLNLFFIPRWGAVGASWATVVSYSGAAIFFFLLFRATRPLAWQGLRIAFAPCMLALLITAVLPLWSCPLPLKFLLALVLYGTGAGMLHVVRREEMERAWQLVRRSLINVRPQAV